MSRKAEWFFGTIPGSWRAVPLKHLCKRSALYGANIAADEYTFAGARFIRTSDICEDGRLEGGGVFLPPSLVKDYLLQEGDFLISRSGTVGRAYVYRTENGTCAYAGYLVRFVLREDQCPQFLFYLTKSPHFQRWLSSSAIEATIGNVNGEKYANILVPAPPFHVQRAIADYLDRETAWLDKLMASKEWLLELLAEKRRALITRAVTRGLNPNAPLRDSGLPWLGEIPEHWDVAQLRRFTRYITSGSRGWAEYYSVEGSIFVRIGNLTRDSIGVDLSDIQHVDPPLGAEGERTRIEPGDLLFSITAYLGSVAVAPDTLSGAYINQHIALVRINRAVLSPEFAAYAAVADTGRIQFDFQGYGGTKVQLALDDVKDIWLPVPPLPEQQAIVAHIASETAKLDALRTAAERTISFLKERRAALIAAAVTGQLDSLALVS
jgi:type I restriction enzyme S subunit